MQKCNKDCFHCPFPDCINDDLSLEEYQEDAISEEVPREVQMNRIRANRYNSNHRELVREKALKNYYDNREREIKRAREWQKKNKERYNAAKRERYHKNIEVERQKQREYRAKKKKELVK